MIVIGIIFVIETYSVIVFPVIAVISVTHKRQDFLHEKKKGKKVHWVKHVTDLYDNEP